VRGGRGSRRNSGGGEVKKGSNNNDGEGEGEQPGAVEGNGGDDKADKLPVAVVGGGGGGGGQEHQS